jgi:hypothetical protein
MRSPDDVAIESYFGAQGDDRKLRPTSSSSLRAGSIRLIVKLVIVAEDFKRNAKFAIVEIRFAQLGVFGQNPA